MWHIIYPGGKKSEITVIEITDNSEYELSDYAIASRFGFDNEDDAVIYAKQLAITNNKFYIGSEFDGNYYLD
jgi:hypothetical protein